MNVLISVSDFLKTVPNNLWIFILVGFVAQMIDGTLGMAYGVSCNSFLLSFGGVNITARIASAMVHMAEVFTTFTSGISHWKLKNIDKKLFLKIMLPGVVGGVIGAYLLSSFDGGAIKPYVNAYLIIMGAVIIIKVFFKPKNFELGNGVYPIGLVGGFFDSVGGGGWGPVVTSTLMASGKDPKKTIGTVNTAEFFVTLATSITFLIAIPKAVSENIWAVIGIVIGGVVAAPFGAILCKKAPVKPLMALVGVLIIFLNVRDLIMRFFP